MLDSTCLVQHSESSEHNRLRTFQIILLTCERTLPQDVDPNETQPEEGTIIELDVSEPDDPDQPVPLVERDHEVFGYQKAQSQQEAIRLFLKSKNFSSEDQFFLSAGEDAGISFRLIAIDDFDISEE